MCPSSGDTTVFTRHLALVILCGSGTLSGMQVAFSAVSLMSTSWRISVRTLRMQNQDMGMFSRLTKHDVRPDVTPCTAAAHQRDKELYKKLGSIKRTAQSACWASESYQDSYSTYGAFEEPRAGEVWGWCNTASLGECLPTFRRNASASFSRVKWPKTTVQN